MPPLTITVGGVDYDLYINTPRKWAYMHSGVHDWTGKKADQTQTFRGLQAGGV